MDFMSIFLIVAAAWLGLVYLVVVAVVIMAGRMTRIEEGGEK